MIADFSAELAQRVAKAVCSFPWCAIHSGSTSPVSAKHFVAKRTASASVCSSCLVLMARPPNFDVAVGRSTAALPREESSGITENDLLDSIVARLVVAGCAACVAGFYVLACVDNADGKFP